MKKFIPFVLSSIALLSSFKLTPQLMAQTSSSPSSSYSSTQGSYSANNSTSTHYTSNSIQWLTSYQEATALAQSTSKRIVILFTGSTWCPACVRLERTVLNQPEFIQAVGQKFVFLKADFEASASNSPYKPLLDQYGVNAFPTFVVVDSNGQLLSKINYRSDGASGYAQALLQQLN